MGESISDFDNWVLEDADVLDFDARGVARLEGKLLVGDERRSREEHRQFGDGVVPAEVRGESLVRADYLRVDVAPS